jgi:hypothetical protein
MPLTCMIRAMYDRDGFGSQFLHNLCAHTMASMNASVFLQAEWRTAAHVDDVPAFLRNVIKLLPPSNFNNRSVMHRLMCRKPIEVPRKCVMDLPLQEYEQVLPLYRRRLRRCPGGRAVRLLLLEPQND